MHQAIPYKSWGPHEMAATVAPQLRRSPTTTTTTTVVSGSEAKANMIEGMMIKNMVSENAVIVFSRRGCCMGHVVRRLLLGHGVNPTVYEVDEEDEVAVVKELEIISKPKVVVMFPAVFIGGAFFGGLETVIAAHISGELVPILKQAGALWL